MATSTVAGVLTLLALLAAVAAQKVTDAACIAESDKCTCSEPTAATGLCTRLQDDGKCLQGACKPSPQCDCLGFELCSIRPSGQFMAAPGAIASPDALFDCVYNPPGSKGSGESRTVIEVVDTPPAADNAKQSANTDVQVALDDQKEATNMIVETTGLKTETLEAVIDIEQIESKVPAEELEQVQAELAEVEEAAAEAETASAELAQATKTCFAKMLEVKRERKLGKQFEREEKEWEEKEKAAKTEEERNSCRVEREKKVVAKKSACRRAGIAAQQGREARKTCGIKKQICQQAKNKCAARVRSCVSRCGAIRGRWGRS